MQDLARFFFELVKILFPGSGLRCCGRGCADCWVWVQLCPSTNAAGAVALGAATAMPAGAGDPPAVPGVPELMQRQVDSRSRGRQRRSPSGGFDWRDVSQVEVSFTCAFFSSSGKYYRSSSVFRGYGSGFLPPTSGRSFIGGASAWFVPLLRLTAVSLACGLAFAVFCGGGGFPRGY